MSEDAKQDLSTLAVFTYGTDFNGKRWVKATLPVPACTKHLRTALTKKPGYRPLVKAAKQYREYLRMSFIVSPPPTGHLEPWLRPDYRWSIVDFSVRRDHDQFAGGLVDDLVDIGVCANDKFCKGHWAGRERVATKAEERIEIHGHEE